MTPEAVITNALLLCMLIRKRSAVKELTFNIEASIILALKILNPESVLFRTQVQNNYSKICNTIPIEEHL